MISGGAGHDTWALQVKSIFLPISGPVSSEILPLACPRRLAPQPSAGSAQRAASESAATFGRPSAEQEGRVGRSRREIEKSCKIDKYKSAPWMLDGRRARGSVGRRPRSAERRQASTASRTGSRTGRSSGRASRRRAAGQPAEPAEPAWQPCWPCLPASDPPVGKPAEPSRALPLPLPQPLLLPGSALATVATGLVRGPGEAGHDLHAYRTEGLVAVVGRALAVVVVVVVVVVVAVIAPCPVDRSVFLPEGSLLGHMRGLWSSSFMLVKRPGIRSLTPKGDPKTRNPTMK